MATEVRRDFMKIAMKQVLIALAVTVVVSSGCASQAVLVGPRVSGPVQLGEERRGGACGFLLFAMLPLGVNSRTERAYANAVGSGGRGLVDTEIKYSWWLIPGGVLLCNTVRGTVIR